MLVLNNLLHDENIISKAEKQVPLLANSVVKRDAGRSLSDSLKRLKHPEKALRVKYCGTLLKFAYVFEEERLKLHKANFCRERLCPICATQRSREIYLQVSQVMQVVEQRNPELTPIFLTLTLRNCSGKKLDSTLDLMFQSWNRLMNNKRIKRIVKGHFRALEVTYNETENNFHPHFHAILLVEPSYFTSPRDYMTTEKWSKTWSKAARLDYNSVAYVCRVDDYKGGKGGKAGAVAEVAKYTVEPTDYIKDDEKLTDRLVSVFGQALKGRRLYAYGGLMRQIHKELELEEPGELVEPGAVMDAAGNVLVEGVDFVFITYRWSWTLKQYKLDAVSDYKNNGKAGSG